MTTQAVDLFGRAKRLTPGEAVIIETASKKKAESLRVLLYRERNRLSDFTVGISVDGTTVTLEKESPTHTYSIRGLDGTVQTEESVRDKNYKKELEEILQTVKELGYTQNLQDELIDNLNERYGRREV